MTEGILYKVGDKVRINGLYVCVPCGYRRRFKVGDTFGECLGCMRTTMPIANSIMEEGSGVTFDGEELAEGLEIWELLREGQYMGPEESQPRDI